MLDGRLRSGVERGLAPAGERLRRIGVTPDQLTIFGLVASVATAVTIGAGYLIWGVVGIAVSGLGDLLDGNVARKTGQTSQRGAFFDSVADRVSDAALLGGVAFYLSRTSTRLPMLAFAVAAVSMLISYERAKAEALGLDARGGLMERAERFVFLAAACAFSALMVPILWVMLGLSSFTAIQRFVKVWRQADKPVRPARPERPERGERGEREPRTVRIVRSAPAIRRREGVPTRPNETDSPSLREWWETRRPTRDRTRPRHPSMRRRTRP